MAAEPWAGRAGQSISFQVPASHQSLSPGEDSIMPAAESEMPLPLHSFQSSFHIVALTSTALGRVRIP